MNSEIKYTIGIDALQMLCVGNIPYLHDNVLPLDNYNLDEKVTLHRNRLLTHPAFNYCYNISIGHKIFAQLFCSNNFKYRFAYNNTCQLKIENHILYQNNLSDNLRLILEALKLVFYKYNYMEIAIDGYGLIESHNKLTYSNKIARKRKIKIHSMLDEKTKENISYRLGSDKSDKHVSLYSKSAEILKSKKEYINEFWQRNHLLNHELQIDRCELRMRDKPLQDFSSDFSQLENPAYLSSYFVSVAGHYLEFYSKQNPKIRHHLIDWSVFDEVTITKITATRKAWNTNRYKGMLRNLFEEYTVTGNEKYVYTLANICARYNLKNWLKRSMPRWLKEFRLPSE